MLNGIVGSNTCLVKVFGFSELSQLRKCLSGRGCVQRVKIDFDGGRDLDFPNRNVGFGVLIECQRLRFEHDGRMTDVMAHPKMPLNQRKAAGMLIGFKKVPSKITNDVLSAVEQATRFRFDAQSQKDIVLFL